MDKGKLPLASRLQQYQFENTFSYIKAIAATHFILWLIFMMGEVRAALQNPHAVICLSIFLLVLALVWQYNWKNPEWNLLVAGIYLTSLVLEWLWWGLPASAAEPYDYMSKGVMLDVFLILVPFIYAGLRVLMIFPLINIYFQARKMQVSSGN